MIGSLYQIYQISEIYFLYETTTYVKYEKEAKVSLPAITLCANKQYFVREECLKNLNLQKLKGNNTLQYYFNILSHLNNITIKEQFSAIYSPKEIFNNVLNCFVMKTKNFAEGYVNCDTITLIKMFIDYRHLCFNIFSQLNEELDDIYLADIKSEPNNFNPLITIAFSPKPHLLTIYLHSRKETISDNENWIPINLIKNNMKSTVISNYLSENICKFNAQTI